MRGPESDKYFKTRMEETNVLFEYQNKTTFTNDLVAITHNGIQPHFQVISILFLPPSLPKTQKGTIKTKNPIPYTFRARPSLGINELKTGSTGIEAFPHEPKPLQRPILLKFHLKMASAPPKIISD